MALQEVLMTTVVALSGAGLWTIYRMRSTQGRRPSSVAVRPGWCTDFGHDAWGAWADWRLGEAVQRFRWCPPGEFWMGSPESEAGRRPNEGPVHRVIVPLGFWLGDTPVTQSLWEAGGGANRSRYRSATRPVELVSWGDVQAWLTRVNGGQTPGFRLPVEAEWEYACRGGTRTATYAGDLQILGTNNAPVLDEIAWYCGNSGVGWDLDPAAGTDTSTWPEKQHQHERAGTRPVKAKRPNAFGLYDMLGNVWEWCMDPVRPYSASDWRVGDEVLEPANDHAERVFRGGSWLDPARYARAAYRDHDRPGFSDVDLGFRLARGQG